jgi:hypothetical protein
LIVCAFQANASAGAATQKQEGCAEGGARTATSIGSHRQGTGRATKAARRSRREAQRGEAAGLGSFQTHPEHRLDLETEGIDGFDHISDCQSESQPTSIYFQGKEALSWLC